MATMKIRKIPEGYEADIETAIQVKIGSFLCPATPGDYIVTGLPFKPRCVEFWLTLNDEAVVRFGLGRMDYNGSQQAVNPYGENTYHRTGFKTNACLYAQNFLGVTIVLAVYKSMNADGFTITFTTTNSTHTIMWKATR